MRIDLMRSLRGVRAPYRWTILGIWIALALPAFVRQQGGSSMSESTAWMLVAVGCFAVGGFSAAVLTRETLRERATESSEAFLESKNSLILLAIVGIGMGVLLLCMALTSAEGAPLATRLLPPDTP